MWSPLQEFLWASAEIRKPTLLMRGVHPLGVVCAWFWGVQRHHCPRRWQITPLRWCWGSSSSPGLRSGTGSGGSMSLLALQLLQAKKLHPLPCQQIKVVAAENC